MSLTPKINKGKTFPLKECASCHGTFNGDQYAPTKSFLYPDGTIPICDSFLDNLINSKEGDWKIVDKICQMIDIPFIPSEWAKIYNANKIGAFHRYAEVFMSSEYDGLNWEDYFKQYKDLQGAGRLESELPLISEEKRQQQRERWGHNYDDDALDYLEGLYTGLMTTQNINGTLQVDQAIKLCKISYTIDQRIEEGADFDKLLGSYDKLVKIAEFTPKNAKNLNDFDTVGEVLRWMEKKGFHNQFYDNVTKDIVDETMKNIENYNQRLYVNESGIGEQISNRIENLKAAREMEQRADANLKDESYYGTDQDYDLDKFDTEGYNDLFKDDGNFDPESGGDCDV